MEQCKCCLLYTSLLNDGCVRVTGLYSEKTGKTYDATVVLEDAGQYANFKLEFEMCIRDRGKTVKHPGWKALEDAYRAKMKDTEPKKEGVEKALPEPVSYTHLL